MRHKYVVLLFKIIMYSKVTKPGNDASKQVYFAA